jgi:anti-sigma regulatory factor (Ser/Thr protein kinase)
MRPEEVWREKEAGWTLLDEFSMASEPGMERPAANRVAMVARRVGLPASRAEQLHTAVAETVLNAMEHGNQYQREQSVLVRVLASQEALAVHVADQGDGGTISEREIPDLAAKLAGQQSVRGWGFYLIEHMVDEVRTLKTEGQHTVELFLYLEGKGSQHRDE